MVRAALSRRAMRGRPQEALCSALFLSYNSIGVLFGNNLVSLYQFSSISIGRNWVDQRSLITSLSHQLLLGRELQVSRPKLM